jgi:hypothetical protein
MSTPIPANCSGLANSGVPANAPGDEIPASEADSSSVFARPRSIIFAVILPSSFRLADDLQCHYPVQIDVERLLQFQIETPPDAPDTLSD